jgi:hypothetical protein
MAGTPGNAHKARIVSKWCCPWITSGLKGDSKGLRIAGIDIPFNIDPASPICELHAAT